MTLNNFAGAYGNPVGVIVKSDSHIRYWAQIYNENETIAPVDPQEYAFGRYVRVEYPNIAQPRHLIGVIYDSMLLNPSFGALGPRLAADDSQRAIFSPDYLSERAVLIGIIAIGSMEYLANGEPASGSRGKEQGAPSFAVEAGAKVYPLTESEIYAFHFYEDSSETAPALHISYLSQMLSAPFSLLPQAALRILDQLEPMFPGYQRHLKIIRRNILWKQSIEPAR